jgi:tetratricopeptide (TPR) repeat protein/tRNA A-37 threonylcarbamoyl transferase component Bud32
MGDIDMAENLVDELAEEFAHRWRTGERPSVEDYAQRYPQWADEIRAVFPAVVMMEQFKPCRADAETSASPPQADDRPQRVGEYRILREIGRGGMGVVYEAEQEALGRRVAIKVLPAHLLANETLRARFHREAQAAARLHHTNIVPVFGVGECDGQCFYVMQLINGRGLDQIIRGSKIEDREAGSGDCQSSILDPRAVARLGVQVADALAEAHAQGILHRDVKPSNLLLDERGAVWVTDFGVAKLVEEANLTQSGDLVGTLKYMPPERFAGQSDARGDVYSLGVTLYELLTLRSAFPDTTPQHLICLITEEMPVRPRKLNPAIPADLETIILKAAARDPAHRYQTAGELAEDLRRFLDDRPILAKRTGPLELAWRWCLRNPALASVTAVAFLLMLAVTVISVAAYVQTAAANREAARANEEMEKALLSETTQREHAERASSLVLGVLNRIYHRFTPTRLVVTPEGSDETEVELPYQPALPPEVVPLLEDLLTTYEQLARTRGEVPKLQAQAAESNYRIGDICRRLGRLDKAVAAYRTAIDLYQRLPAEAVGDTERIKLARTYNELGRTLHSRQQFDEAVRMHEHAIAALTDVPAAFAARPECRYELARAYCLLGQRDMLTQGGRGPGGPGPPGGPGGPGHGPPGGKRRPPRDGPPPPHGPPGHGPEPKRDHARRAVVLLERLVEEFPKVPEYRHLLACCYRDVPPERLGRGKPERSKADRAVQLLRRLVKDFPKVPDYRLDLCEALARPGPPPRHEERDTRTEKQQRLEEAVTLSEQLVLQYPSVPDYAAAHARYLDGLGIALYEAKALSQAEVVHRKAVDGQNKLVKQYPEVIAYRFWLGLMERSLGRVLGERGQMTEARTLLESATNRVEALWQKDSRLGGARPFLGMAYRDLARVYTRIGEAALAAAALRKAEEFGPDRGPGPRRLRERRGGRP